MEFLGGRRIARAAVLFLLFVACSDGGEEAATEPFVAGDGLLVPAELPGRLRVLGMSEVPRVGDERPPAEPVVMYAGSSDPARDAPVVFATVRPARQVDFRHATERVRGHPAVPDVVPPYGQVFAAPSLTWEETSDLALVVWGARVGQGTVADVAERIGLDRAGRPAAEDLPHGYEEVGSLERGWRTEPGVRMGLQRGRHGTILESVEVRRVAVNEARVLMALVKADPEQAYADVGLNVFFVFGAPERVDVGGHPAVVGRIAPLIRVLIIEGDPGAVVLSEGNDDYPDVLSIDELVATAESLEVVAPGDFEQRVADLQGE